MTDKYIADLRQIKARIRSILPNLQIESKATAGAPVGAVAPQDAKRAFAEYQSCSRRPDYAVARARNEVHKVRRSLANLNKRMAKWTLEEQRGYSTASPNRKCIGEIRSLRPPKPPRK